MWNSIFNRRMLICIFSGFSSGMPLYVLTQLIPTWLRDAKIDLATIGLFSLISLPYVWKFLWSPLLDRYTPPFWGRRRGWALLTQIGLLFSLAALSPLDPQSDIKLLIPVVACIALWQCIAILVLFGNVDGDAEAVCSGGRFDCFSIRPYNDPNQCDETW